MLLLLSDAPRHLVRAEVLAAPNQVFHGCWGCCVYGVVMNRSACGVEIQAYLPHPVMGVCVRLFVAWVP